MAIRSREIYGNRFHGDDLLNWPFHKLGKSRRIGYRPERQPRKYEWTQTRRSCLRVFRRVFRKCKLPSFLQELSGRIRESIVTRLRRVDVKNVLEKMIGSRSEREGRGGGERKKNQIGHFSVTKEVIWSIPKDIFVSYTITILVYRF